MRFWEELFKNLKEHHWHDSLRKLTFPLLEEMKIFSVLTDVDLTSSVPSARMIQSAEVSDSFFWGLLWPLLFYSRFSLALFWPWRYVSQKSNQNEGKTNKGQARVLLLYHFRFFFLYCNHTLKENAYNFFFLNHSSTLYVFQRSVSSFNSSTRILNIDKVWEILGYIFSERVGFI